jgi:hypothetical protein
VSSSSSGFLVKTYTKKPEASFSFSRVKYGVYFLKEFGHVSQNTARTKMKEQNGVHFPNHAILTNDDYSLPPTSFSERPRFVAPPRETIVHGIIKTVC